MSNFISNLFGASWKTAAAGYASGALLILGEIFDVLLMNVAPLTDGQFEFAKIATGLGLLGLGWFARDNDVSSEQAKQAP